MKCPALLERLALCCGASLLVLAVSAQQNSSIVGSTVREDLVQADLSTASYAPADSAFHRTAKLEQDNSYAVTITYPNGPLRMTGSYLDSALSIPDGTFTYYYPNGNKESTGAFVNGVKAGTWSCAMPDGTPRADRIYSGLDWDDLQVQLGLSERAATTGEMDGGVQQWERSLH